MAPGLMFSTKCMLQLSITESEVAITLHFELWSARYVYSAIQMKNSTRNAIQSLYGKYRQFPLQM